MTITFSHLVTHLHPSRDYYDLMAPVDNDLLDRNCRKWRNSGNKQWSGWILLVSCLQIAQLLGLLRESMTSPSPFRFWADPSLSHSFWQFVSFNRTALYCATALINFSPTQSRSFIRGQRNRLAIDLILSLFYRLQIRYLFTLHDVVLENAKHKRIFECMCGPVWSQAGWAFHRRAAVLCVRVLSCLSF